MVEPLEQLTFEERQQHLEKAGYNLFHIPAEAVFIDLLTDSGTSAMSQAQWAGMIEGDESYSGAKSYYRLRDAVLKLTGMPYFFPVHQGRAAERILFSILAQPGCVIPNNTHFDTTRANIEARGALALDLAANEGWDLTSQAPFKGNMDLAKLDALLREAPSLGLRVPVVFITATNNSNGGQPISLKHLEALSELCKSHRVPLFLDACRFAENAYFIQQREYPEKSIETIAREMFSLVDGATFSAKKDGLVNIGGLLLMRDSQLFEQTRAELILGEGFVTYGGLAGRDLEALAIGLHEVLDASYLAHRIQSLEQLGQRLHEARVPLMRPAGGHALYLDAETFCAHLPREHFPGQSLACALYLLGGIRTTEVGQVLGSSAANVAMQQKLSTLQSVLNLPARTPLELVRLAFPRRVYTQNHLDFVAEIVEGAWTQRTAIMGLTMTESPPALKHFLARFAPKPLSPWVQPHLIQRVGRA